MYLLQPFRRLVCRFFPALEEQPLLRQWQVALDAAGVVLCFPLILAGLIWLITVSRVTLLFSNLAAVTFLVTAILLFARLPYFVISEIGKGRFSDMSGTLDEQILWAGVLIAGPVMLWVGVGMAFYSLGRELIAVNSVPLRLNRLRNLCLNLVGLTICAWLGLTVYRMLGGVIPMPGLALHEVFAAVAGLGVQFFANRLLWLLFFGGLVYLQQKFEPGEQVFHRRWAQFAMYALFLPGLALPAAVLAAGIDTFVGLPAFAMYLIGLLVAAFILNRMSRLSESNRQQRQQFVHLEELGRDLLLMPPDQPNLPALLARHVPSMFAHASIEIRLFPDQVLFCHKEDYPGAPEEAWRWLMTQTESGVFSSAHLPRWEVLEEEDGWVLTPVLDTDKRQVLGGIYLALSRWHPSGADEVGRLLVALQTLAATIASAQVRAREYAQTLNYQRTLQELDLAGQIQQSFLPASLPVFPGWQISAVLKPAQQASGDFYDVIPLPAGRLGLVVADVADKGMGAALFMALTRTLLRTYILDAKTPAETLRATNQRILTDTSSEQFVTAFVAVLDTATGELVYASAGHNPPLALSCAEPVSAALLNRTGIPLGIYENITWEEGRLFLGVGQPLVCYTDGVTDAQNLQGESYGLEMLEKTVCDHVGDAAGEIQRALLASVEDYCAGAAQFDDMTLLVIKREMGSIKE